MRALASGEAATRKAALRDLRYGEGMFFPEARKRAQPSKRQLDQLFSCIERTVFLDADDSVRFEAAHVLAAWHEGRAARVLIRVLSSINESAPVRGQAAEGIGSILWYFPDEPLTRQARALRDDAIHVLRKELQDVDPGVRFWCVYALGQMHAIEARAELEGLRGRDHALGGPSLPGASTMWTVATEAASVLTYWDTGTWPDPPWDTGNVKPTPIDCSDSSSRLGAP